MDGLQAELARLDLLLVDLLRRLRRRGRSQVSEAAHGLVIEEGEAEGLLAELMSQHTGSADAAAPSAVSPTQYEAVWPPLVRARKTFGLDRFEADVLLLALAVEIDGRYARLVGFLNDHAAQVRPTVGLAVALLGRAAGEWRSFFPQAPLLHHALVSLEGDGPLSAQSIRLAQTLWPRLAGQDTALPAGVRLCAPADAVTWDDLVLPDPVRQRAMALSAWAAAEPRALLLVHGRPGSGRSALAAALAQAARPGAPILIVEGEALSNGDPAALARDALWYGASVVVHAIDSKPSPVALTLLRTLTAFVVWVTNEPAIEPLAASTGRLVIDLALPNSDVELRTSILNRLLGNDGGTRRDEVLALASRFSFGPGRWQLALRLARERARAERGREATLLPEDLSHVCRALPEVELGALAQRLQSPFVLDDVIVPTSTRAELELGLAWVRHRRRVFGTWGLGQKIFAGRGLACLFFGPPGTGKTMAAQAMANALGLDLFRIDLSQVVSKYIGETEKNLAGIFAAAESASAILFFDEADALFGKRTEVSDAHDRYANVETGFLLQRMEMHEGVTILATNLHQNLDDAFLRRMAIVAEFPLPQLDERQRIWERLLPAGDYRGVDVDVGLLARAFALSGGEIRNAVLAAAVMAADQGAPLGMAHLAVAVHRELRKSGRLVDPSAFGPWSASIKDRLEHPTGRTRDSQ